MQCCSCCTAQHSQYDTRCIQAPRQRLRVCSRCQLVIAAMDNQNREASCQNSRTAGRHRVRPTAFHLSHGCRQPEWQEKLWLPHANVSFCLRCTQRAAQPEGLCSHTAAAPCAACPLPNTIITLPAPCTPPLHPPSTMARASTSLSLCVQQACSWPLKPCGGCAGAPSTGVMYSRRSNSWRCADK